MNLEERLAQFETRLLVRFLRDNAKRRTSVMFETRDGRRFKVIVERVSS